MDTTLPKSGKESSGQSERLRLELEQALQTYPYWNHIHCASQPVVIKTLDAGLTNSCYILQAGDERCVLRINAINSRVMGLDRVNEKVALKNAEQAGIGPTVVYCSPQQGLLVTKYVAGRHWLEKEARIARNIERIAELLKQVHVLPATNKLLIPQDVVERYWQGIKAQFIMFPPWFKALHQTMDRVMCAAEAICPERYFCHNDLVLGNIIDTGEKMVLLDWEYAAMGDPLFDLAVIVHNQHFNEHQLRQLLQCYLGYVNDTVQRHFLYNYAIYIYLDILWYWLQSASYPSQGFVAIAEGKRDTLVAILHELGI